MSTREFLELKEELHAKPRRKKKKTPDMEFSSETKNPPWNLIQKSISHLHVSRNPQICRDFSGKLHK